MGAGPPHDGIDVLARHLAGLNRGSEPPEALLEAAVERACFQLQAGRDLPDGEPVHVPHFEHDPVLRRESAERVMQSASYAVQRRGPLAVQHDLLHPAVDGKLLQALFRLEARAGPKGYLTGDREQGLRRRRTRLAAAKDVQDLVEGVAVPVDELVDLDGDRSKPPHPRRGPPFAPALDLVVEKDALHHHGQVGAEAAAAEEFPQDRKVVFHQPHHHMGGEVFDVLGRESVPAADGPRQLPDQAQVRLEQLWCHFNHGAPPDLAESGDRRGGTLKRLADLRCPCLVNVVKGRTEQGILEDREVPAIIPGLPYVRKHDVEGAVTTPEPDVSAGESTVQLLLRAQTGDREALECLYRLYVKPLQRYAHGRLPPWARGSADTDDLVQDTLLSSLRGVNAFEPERTGAFLAYLCQAIRNRIRDEIRRVHRRPQAGETAGNVPDVRPLPVDEIIAQEVMDSYEAALARLKPEDQEAIVARVQLGLSFQQIAQALGKPSADAARVATSRAIKRLAEEMAHVR